MKEKVDLREGIFAETQAKFPHIDWYKFEVLYHGWRTKGIKHGRNAQFYVIAWKRGWLAPKDANDFREYIGLL